MKHTRLFAGVLTAFVFLLCLCPAALAADSDPVRYLPDPGLTVSIPEGVRVLTQEMEDTDPNLMGLDMTASTVSYLLAESQIVLEAFPDDDSWILDIMSREKGSRLVFTDDLEDLSVYEESYLDSLLEELRSQEDGALVERRDLGGHPFFFAEFQQDDAVDHVYISVIGEQEVWLNFSAGADVFDQAEPVWEDILGSVALGDARPEEPAEEAAPEEPAEAPEPAETPEPEPADPTPVLYTLPEDELVIELPSDLMVITADMAEDDPALAFAGMTAAQAAEHLAAFGNCLDVFPVTLDWELVAATQTNQELGSLGDVALFGEEDFEKAFEDYGQNVIDGLAEGLGIPPEEVTLEDESSVLLGGLRFRRVTFSYSSENTLFTRSTQYITMLGGRAYSFSFNGDGLTRPEQEEILATVQLTAEPTGITELRSGLGFDWGRIGRDAAIGAVTAGVLGGLAAVLGRKKKGGAHADGSSDRPQDSGAPYSIPGASGHADSEEENTP